MNAVSKANGASESAASGANVGASDAGVASVVSSNVVASVVSNDVVANDSMDDATWAIDDATKMDGDGTESSVGAGDKTQAQPKVGSLAGPVSKPKSSQSGTDE